MEEDMMNMQVDPVMMPDQANASSNAIRIRSDFWIRPRRG